METNEHPSNSQPSSLALNVEILCQAPLDFESPQLPGNGRIIAPIPLLRLGVRTATSHFKDIEFIVDTGADISAISMLVAEENSIPYDTSQRVPMKGVADHPINDSFLNKIDLQVGTAVCTINCLIYDSGE